VYATAIDSASQVLELLEYETAGNVAPNELTSRLMVDPVVLSWLKIDLVEHPPS
jgi:hypothetical protein